MQHDFARHPINDEAFATSRMLQSLKNGLPLLLPYPNNGLHFYDAPYWLEDQEKQWEAQWITFGADFGGCFVLEKEKPVVHYLYHNGNTFDWMFCNQSFQQFVVFNNMFISLVIEKISRREEAFFTDKHVQAMEDILTGIDTLSFRYEHTYWSMRLYELSDGMFPLDGAVRKFHEKMGI